MLCGINCYKVKVRTTNGLGTTSHTKPFREFLAQGGEYFNCENGIAYVVARSMAEVEELLGLGNILACERVGIGYVAGLSNQRAA